MKTISRTPTWLLASLIIVHGLTGLPAAFAADSLAVDPEVLSPADLQSRGLRVVEPLLDSAVVADHALVNPGTAADLAVAADALPGSAANLTLNVGEYQQVHREVGTTPTNCSRVSGGRCLRTSVGFLLRTAQNQVLNLVLDTEAPTKLRYASAEAHFAATFFVKLTDLESTATTRFPEPIQIAILSDADNITPQTRLLQIERTNQFTAIELSDTDPVDPLTVTLAANRQAEPAKVSFTVDRPRLSLSVAPTLLGYGLEKMAVEVRLANGTHHSDRSVTLTAERGSLDHTALRFDESGRASTFLRSQGTGEELLRAELAPFESAEAVINYKFPTSWLVSMLIGGVLGFFGLRTLQQRPTGSWLKGLLVALCTGAIGAGLLALGVNLLDIALPTDFSELAVVVASALSTALLLPILSRKSVQEKGSDHGQ